jgi:hypothetical protein
MSAAVDSSMLIQCPVCATFHQLKLGFRDAAGGAMRRVRCRQVWRATAHLGRHAALGQTTALAHACQTAAPMPAKARSSESGEVQTLGFPPPAQARSADNRTGALDGAPVRDPWAHVPVMNTTTRWSSAPVDRSELITAAEAPSLAPMDHNPSHSASRIRAKPWAHRSHEYHRGPCYSPFDGGGAACQPRAPDPGVSRAGPGTGVDLCWAPRVQT